MSRTTKTARSARDELAAVAAGRGRELDLSALRSLPRAPNSRRAAVLLLFGVLDHRASDHAAQATAVSDDLDVLLLARASTLRSHAGQIAFPGGRVDPGDDGVVDAALREAHEETGLDPAGVEVLGVLDDVPLAYSRHVVSPVLAWWQRPSAVRVVDERESSYVFRVPVADLLAAGNRGTVSLNRDGTTWRGPAFLITQGEQEHLVWGFTAMLLDRLFARLGWEEPWDSSREFPLPPPLP